MRRFASIALVLTLLVPKASLGSAIDSDLRAALAALARGEEINATLGLLERATRTSPDLGAAHLLRAELFGLLAGLPKAEGLSRADGPSDMGTREARLRPSADVEALREELRARAALLGRPQETLPLNVLNLEPGIEHVVLVDLSAPRVFLLARRGQMLSVEAEYYASVGLERGAKTREGDLRTPVGAYRIQGELRGRALRPYHGPLALVLDYPNMADRGAGRTGSHIWIHGVPPGVAARPPFSTEGCVALSNKDLLNLRAAIRPERTKVVIVERTEWVSDAVWLEARTAAVATAPRSTLVSLDAHTPIMGLQRDGRINPAVAPPVFAASGPEAESSSSRLQAPERQLLVGPGPTPVNPVRTGPLGEDQGAPPALRPNTSPPPEAGPAGPRRRVAAVNPATLRREPRGEAIGTIARGDQLDVIGEMPGGWLMVRFGDKRGFVHATNLIGS